MLLPIRGEQCSRSTPSTSMEGHGGWVWVSGAGMRYVGAGQRQGGGWGGQTTSQVIQGEQAFLFFAFLGPHSCQSVI
jgi:hypothetical protein